MALLIIDFGSLKGSAETAFIETIRYKIFYKNEHAEYALNLASVIDKHFDDISRFIGHEPSKRLILRLAESGSLEKAILDPASFESGSGMQVFADYEYRGNLHRIHEFTVQSLLSDPALKTSVFRKWRGGGRESWIPSAVSSYIIYGLHSRSSIFIRDILQRGDRLSINNEAARAYSDSEIRALQIGFIHFIKEYYGMRVLSIALKNISYYGSLQNALEKITGLTGGVITGDFNSFYYNKYKEIPEQKNFSLSELFVTDIDDANLLASDMEGRRLYAEKRKNGAVLYITEGVKGNDSRVEAAHISFNPAEVKKIKGAFVKGGGAAAAITKMNGTQFLVYKSDPYIPDKSIFLPYVFCMELAENQLPGYLVFSASEGSRTDIFTLNTESMDIIRISDSKGNYRSPALSDGDITLSEID